MSRLRSSSRRRASSALAVQGRLGHPDTIVFCAVAVRTTGRPGAQPRAVLRAGRRRRARAVADLDPADRGRLGPGGALLARARRSADRDRRRRGLDRSGCGDGGGRWSPTDAVKYWVGLTALGVASAVLGVIVRQRRALLASLQERAARLEFERDQEGRLGAAAERARIAREMHDIVSHNLTVMIALADGADSRCIRARRRRRGHAARLGDRPPGARRDAPAARRAAGRADAPSRSRRSPRLDRLDELLAQVRPPASRSRSRSRAIRTSSRGRPAHRLPGRPGSADQHAQARGRPRRPGWLRMPRPRRPRVVTNDRCGRTRRCSAAAAAASRHEGTRSRLRRDARGRPAAARRLARATCSLAADVDAAVR